MIRFWTAFLAMMTFVSLDFAQNKQESAYVYHQKTGKLTLNNQVITTGYSGKGKGLNNPSMQGVKNTGPIPKGLYKIREPRIFKGMKNCFDLTPVGDTETFGRSEFLIHGDNTKKNQSASEGCIIIDKSVRDEIAKSKIRLLRVIAD